MSLYSYVDCIWNEWSCYCIWLNLKIFNRKCTDGLAFCLHTIGSFARLRHVSHTVTLCMKVLYIRHVRNCQNHIKRKTNDREKKKIKPNNYCISDKPMWPYCCCCFSLVPFSNSSTTCEVQNSYRNDALHCCVTVILWNKKSVWFCFRGEMTC